MTEDRTVTFTSMDPRPPTPAEVLEELANTFLSSLMPVKAPQSAFANPMALPASYTGDAAGCGSFLLQVVLLIEIQLQKFTTEHAKVAFLISLLSVRAVLWAKGIWNASSNLINSYEAFSIHFKVCFTLLQ